MDKSTGGDVFNGIALDKLLIFCSTVLGCLFPLFGFVAGVDDDDDDEEEELVLLCLDLVDMQLLCYMYDC